jgi:catechol 2,3-dioxygenase-like lactoylglutathione lyase family enzyme
MQPGTVSSIRIEAVDLDHVAHAVHRWKDVWGRYMGDLGASWVSGGVSVGFAPAQIRFANGAKLEMLMPHDVRANDFLQRFLARSGPGPHHLTFKVPDLARALGRIETAGYDPIGVNLDDPDWKEAFIHPKQATGIVVQIAQPVNEWFAPPPEDSPHRSRELPGGKGPARPASLSRIVHLVRDLDEATRLFVDLLGGEIAAEYTDHEGRPCLDLRWSGPSRLRLVAASAEGTDAPDADLAVWLGDRPGRLHHLELEAQEPEGLPGSRRLDSHPAGLVRGPHPVEYDWEIPADVNAGLRLVIRSEV